MPESATSILETQNIITGYRNKQVLNGVSVAVDPQEIVGIVGHNGAGKSTLLKAIFGMIPLWDGLVCIRNENLSNHSPRDLLNRGVSFVPQGKQVFGELTVRDNLMLAGTTLTDRTRLSDRIDRVLSFFPALKSHLYKRAGLLSGGEKQMVALSSVLILSPSVLLLDEPSLGLSPQLVDKTFDRLEKINQETDVSMLIVEQKVREVMGISNRIYVLENGRISFSGSPGDLEDEERLRSVYL